MKSTNYCVNLNVEEEEEGETDKEYIKVELHTNSFLY